MILGIPLVPLANGTWGRFATRTSSIMYYIIPLSTSTTSTSASTSTPPLDPIESRVLHHTHHLLVDWTLPTDLYTQLCHPHMHLTLNLSRMSEEKYGCIIKISITLSMAWKR